MATPDLAGKNLLNPRRFIVNYNNSYGFTVEYLGDDMFRLSGAYNRSAPIGWVLFTYYDYTLSGKGYTVQLWHVEGDAIVTDPYGLRTPTERGVAVTLDSPENETVSETFLVSVSSEPLPDFVNFSPVMITDRSRFDVQAVKDIKARLAAGTATEEDGATWAAGMKGAMSADDWNRIQIAIYDYITHYAGRTSVTNAEYNRYVNGVVSVSGTVPELPEKGLAALSAIAEKIYAEAFGNYSRVPHDFGDGTSLTYQQANNIEALLAAAFSPVLLGNEAKAVITFGGVGIEV